MHRAFPLAAVTLIAAACGPRSAAPTEEPGGQSFEDALAVICGVDAHAEVTTDTDPIDAETARTDYLRNAVSNGDAIELLTYVRVEGPAKRAELLRDAAERAGMSRCALADSFDREAREADE